MENSLSKNGSLPRAIFNRSIVPIFTVPISIGNYQPHPSPPLEKEGTVKGKVKSVAFILAVFVLPVTVHSLFGEGLGGVAW